MRARFAVGCVVGWLVLLAAQAAAAQSDPPGRVARLNLNEGSLAFSPAGDTEWTDAVLNRPLTRGDRLWADRGSRAELHAGAIALRMGGQTLLAFVALDEHAAQFSLTHGAVQARVRELAEGENVQLDTPNLSFRAVQAGDYRVDVDPERGTTRVTVHAGTGMAYGENGQALPLGGGQQVEFRGRVLAQVSAQEAPPLDVFDRWAAERDRREDQSVSARYLPREVTGYQQLDAFGKWSRDAALGPVWQPRDVDAGWIPFRYGRWDLVAPWGWTWIDEAPWGFATSHYGRWTQLSGRWAWVPGRMAARPVYAPALVGFVGSPSGDGNARLDLGSGQRGVGWFPLGPGEAWRPGYKASPVYVGNINRNMTVGEPPGGAYAHRRAESVTALLLDDFLQGRPVRGRAQRLALGELARLQVTALPGAPGRQSLPQPPRLEIARVAPPAAAGAGATAPATLASAVPAIAPAPAVQDSASRQLTITRDQVQAALQTQRTQREKARLAEQTQRDQAQAQAKARLAQAQREKGARDKALHEKTQREALARRKIQQEQAARQVQAARLARLQKERKEQAQRSAAAERAQEQARHEAQVRRLLGMAHAEAQARRDEQERQERRREEQSIEDQRRLQAQREAQQRQQPPSFAVPPPYGMPVWRGGRS